MDGDKPIGRQTREMKDTKNGREGGRYRFE